MYKFVLVVLALIAVASAQLLASPYAYGGVVRSGLYAPAVTTYTAGAYPYAAYGSYLYK